MATIFKLQAWHVQTSCECGSPEHENVLGAFETRMVAEEVRDNYNAENHKIGVDGNAFICLCDCPDRNCVFLEVL